MKKTITVFVLAIVSLALLTTTVAAGVLYLNEQTESKNTAKKNEDLESQVLVLERSLTDLSLPEVDMCTESCLITFEDEEIDAQVTFPITWSPILNQEITEDFLLSEVTDGFGPLLADYEFRLEQGDVVLTFIKLLGPVDGFPQGLSEDESTIVTLDEGVVRHQLIGEDSWTYAMSDTCPEDDIFGPEYVDADMCVTQFFPGFGTRFPTQIFLEEEDGSLLAQADAIVISTLN